MSASLPVQTVFGNHIRQWREHAGLTVEQLSEKTGFSSHRLRAIERGEINLNLGTLLILAMSMDRSLQEFLSSVAPKLHDQKFSVVRIIPFRGTEQQNHC
jgi:transcriptional regulator with XRE-family HTH domain